MPAPIAFPSQAAQKIPILADLARRALRQNGVFIALHALDLPRSGIDIPVPTIHVIPQLKNHGCDVVRYIRTGQGLFQLSVIRSAQISTDDQAREFEQQRFQDAHCRLIFLPSH
jgi:hypothetical protein